MSRIIEPLLLCTNKKLKSGTQNYVRNYFILRNVEGFYVLLEIPLFDKLIIFSIKNTDIRQRVKKFLNFFYTVTDK